MKIAKNWSFCQFVKSFRGDTPTICNIYAAKIGSQIVLLSATRVYMQVNG